MRVRNVLLSFVTLWGLLASGVGVLLAQEGVSPRLGARDPGGKGLPAGREGSVAAPAEAPADEPAEVPAAPPAAANAGVPAGEVEGESPGAQVGDRDGEAEAAKEGSLGGGLRGILNLLSDGGAKGLGLDEGEGDKAKDAAQTQVIDLTRVASLNISKGRVSDAMRNINDLISLKPYDADYHFALGLCFRKLGKHTEALKKYQDVLDLGGPKALVSLLKAESHATEGDKDNAFRFLREAAVGGRNIINDVSTLPTLRPYKEDTEFIKLALQLEKFEVNVSRKHDPFTNPFPLAMRDAGDARQQEAGDSAPASLNPEEQDKLLREAKKLYARVQFYIKLEDETKAMRAYKRLQDILAQKDLITIPKLINDFRFLQNQTDAQEVQIEGIRLRFYYNQALGKLKSMKDNFADGEYQRVESIHAEVVELTDEMARTNDQYKPVAERVLQSSLQWVNRAKVRQEFESHKPNMQGIVISEDGKMAVLNDRVVKQGELIDDFRVLKVENNKVTFRYKGEEIPLVFRRY